MSVTRGGVLERRLGVPVVSCFVSRTREEQRSVRIGFSAVVRVRHRVRMRVAVRVSVMCDVGMARCRDVDVVVMVRRRSRRRRRVHMAGDIAGVVVRIESRSRHRGEKR